MKKRVLLFISGLVFAILCPATIDLHSPIFSGGGIDVGGGSYTITTPVAKSWRMGAAGCLWDVKYKSLSGALCGGHAACLAWAGVFVRRYEPSVYQYHFSPILSSADKALYPVQPGAVQRGGGVGCLAFAAEQLCDTGRAADPFAEHAGVFGGGPVFCPAALE